MSEFARIWQRADKVVFSSTLQEVSTERTRIERSFDLETVGTINGPWILERAFSGFDRPELGPSTSTAAAGTAAELRGGVRSGS